MVAMKPDASVMEVEVTANSLVSGYREQPDEESEASERGNLVVSPYRVGCLISHPIQYQVPLFRHLSRNPAIDLTVFFYSDLSLHKYHDPGFGVDVSWDVPLLGGYKHVFLPALGDSTRLSFSHPISRGLVREFRRSSIEALWVCGYAHNVCLRAIAVAKLLGIKVLFYGDPHDGGPHEYSPRKEAIKRRVLPPLFRLIDGFLATATANARYYQRYGVPAERIFLSPYCADNDFFREKCVQAHSRREVLRAELGFEENRPIILYASKLQRRKRPLDLVEAYVRLSVDGAEPLPYLLFIGDGEEREALQNRIAQLRWTSIRLLGFRNQTELPGLFDLCDVFVLPSEREGLATVVAEVMNAAKPVVVTNVIGLADDLIVDGSNGFIIRPRDTASLTDRLKTLTSDLSLAAKMGERGLRSVSRWNYQASESGLLEALHSVLKR